MTISSAASRRRAGSAAAARLMRRPPRRSSNTRSRLGRQGDGERLAFADAEVAHGVGGEIASRIARSRAASGRSVARQKAPRKSSSSTVTGMALAAPGSTPRMRTSSGRSPSLHALAPRRAAASPLQASASGPTRTRPGPATTASNMFMAPTKSATKAVRRTAVDLRRRFPPARRGRGSSPRCGRPWPAPPPGRG